MILKEKGVEIQKGQIEREYRRGIASKGMVGEKSSAESLHKKETVEQQGVYSTIP